MRNCRAAEDYGYDGGEPVKWVVATSNPGKLREFRAIFDAYGLELISKDEAGVAEDPEETGTTFEENALIKARACAEACGLPTVSDDSGMTVDALGGAPGIYSARYAEPGHRKERVLRELENVPDGERGGAFYCAIACVVPGECEFTVSGECRGTIAHEPAGTGGFGYDPIFCAGIRQDIWRDPGGRQESNIAPCAGVGRAAGKVDRNGVYPC